MKKRRRERKSGDEILVLVPLSFSPLDNTLSCIVQAAVVYSRTEYWEQIITSSASSPAPLPVLPKPRFQLLSQGEES